MTTKQDKANELRRAAQRAARIANPWMPINPFDTKEDQAAQLAARAAIAERHPRAR
jgi:alkanesulfonate monooxygenase SsuD/methylene tetrahydromethanopterin reductase-like flavin-dependent oxidoreductase (luciferase family)